MKKAYKNIIIIAIFFILGILIWYNFSDLRVKSNAKSPNDKSNVALNKTKNNSSKELNEKKNIDKPLHNIVIYNTHADEEYDFGKKITDISALISHRLNNEGLNSSFIKCDPPKEYMKAYEVSRDAITKNIKKYEDIILLDIHRDISGDHKLNPKRMLIVLTKKNPCYESNKKFAESLLKEINKSNSVKCEILLRNEGILYYNQDLSNNAVLIELGNNKSSNSDIEECMNALISALKNVEKTL
ncbi:stage II sporulation protein P [Clostridium lundense]|uniref:stage II sporulation protein P n=1 Tax=Clostridium lundense TaxID=319475 RepID=UPI00068838BC|nr:stage II sporulation protein P [Clostridium lundense]